MKTYEEKLAALKEKHKLEILNLSLSNALEHQFPEITGNGYYTRTKDGLVSRVWFDVKTKQDIQTILKSMPPTELSTTFGTAGNDKGYTVESPYRLDTESEVNGNHLFKIQYQSADTEVQIKCPIRFIKKYLIDGHRPPSSSEDHYFGGVSRKQMEATRISTFKFFGENVPWYGGNFTALNVDAIKDIMAYLETCID